MSRNEANVTPDDKLYGQRFLWSIVPTMNIKYFQDTDTLYIEFKSAEVAESKDLDENTVLDLDQSGNILGITVEHASQRADIPRFSYEQVAA
ncbi:MAG: hypothetical protein QOH71_1306 [Blastocatellia bacterium]|jgi:uncharacterized protein YuzE|nr:hypothetical protein [Blastocatellia bacterium]